MSTYNGWKNWETWNTYTWLSNEESSYLQCRYLASRESLDINEFRLSIEEEILELDNKLVNGLLADFINASLNEVDWEEIRNAFTED